VLTVEDIGLGDFPAGASDGVLASRPLS